MRNLIVCSDGTWNTPGNLDGTVPAPTNVVRIHAALAKFNEDDVEQIRYYRQGVGSSGWIGRRVYRGLVGGGVVDDIKSAYKWLAETYRPDDRIFLFGFSRGAYTVRSLAGMIASVGLLDLTAERLKEDEKWLLVKSATRLYKNSKRRKQSIKEKPVEASRSRKFMEFARRPDAVPIHFLGVWDTVGALGIPDDWALAKHVLSDPNQNLFHDTNLGNLVRIARHAVGLDETRVDFVPTLWTNLRDGTADKDVDLYAGDAKQVWFPGVHGDIGGSYYNRDLGDLTLKWMMEEAKSASLGFREGDLEALKGNPRGLLHISTTGVFRNRQTRPRAVPDLSDADENGLVLDQSLKIRRVHPAPSETDYWTTIRLEVGETWETKVRARERWAKTGVYMKPGERYEFAAKGEWLDASVLATPAGVTKPWQAGRIGHVVGTLSEFPRKLYRNMFRTSYAENLLLRAGRRFEQAPWFSLVGVVANGRGADEKTKRRRPHEEFLIGSKHELNVTQGGFLYCYANDAWGFYGNNYGSVTLTVTRLR